METACSAIMYSHAHSPPDGWQNYFICLSSVTCKAVHVLCFIKGLELSSIKEGPCLPCSSFCSPSYTGTLLLLGHRAQRAGLYTQTNSWKLSHAHLHSSLSRRAGQLQGPCRCDSLFLLWNLFLGNKLSLGALLLTQQPAGTVCSTIHCY